MGVRVPKPVFEIKHWEIPDDPDDGLKINTCWPSMLVPSDPGFALLTNDPWYQKNKLQAATAAVYGKPPAPEIINGKIPLWVKKTPAVPDPDADGTNGADPDAMDIDPPTAGAARRDLNGTSDEGLYDPVEEDREYREYIRMMYERYAGPPPSLTQPAAVPAQPTVMVEENASLVAAPTLKTIVRKSVTAEIVNPTRMP